MSATGIAGSHLHLTGLGKQYAGVAAVDAVDLEIASGEFLTLLGPSGSGKTTTLSMIAGFTEPSAGRVVLDGAEITTMPPHKRGLGMVFQNYSLFPHLNVRENVEFPLRQRGVGKADRAKRALAALELVELQGRADAKPSQLSGGQQQRVALARALVFQPRLLLMDEPFGALDRALRERLQIELRRLHRELGITVIFVTHDQEEALTLSDRIAVFNNGRIEQVGTPEELYERPQTLFVARFIGESNALHGFVDRRHFVSRGGVTFATDAADGPAVAIIRPERTQVIAPGASDADRVSSGTVRDVTYLGSQRRMEVDTEDGTLVVRAGTGVPAPAIGEAVELRWDPQDAAIFPITTTHEETSQQWTDTLALPT